jgi:hypothetical protein
MGTTAADPETLLHGVFDRLHRPMQSMMALRTSLFGRGVIFFVLVAVLAMRGPPSAGRERRDGNDVNGHRVRGARQETRTVEQPCVDVGSQ